MDDLPGQTLGGYRLEALLGRGANAAVYRARHPATGVPVALRVLDPGAADDPDFGTRFRHALARVAALRHPALLPILDFGEDRGCAFIARPYTADGSLRGRLGEPLALAAVGRLLRPIAEALDEAHASGVVHGDLKPGDLLLAGPDRLLLADLGTAQALAASNRLVAGARGHHGGTPEYLAPEQVLGRPADGRTDLYALAVIAYEALTGRSPFRAAGASDTTRQLMLHHLDSPPPPPRVLCATLTPAAEAALLRALAKDPAARFANCVAFLDALLADRAVAAAGTAAIAAMHAADPGRRADGAGSDDAARAAPPARPAGWRAMPRWGRWALTAGGLAAALLVGRGTTDALAGERRGATPRPATTVMVAGSPWASPVSPAASPVPSPVPVAASPTPPSPASEPVAALILPPEASATPVPPAPGAGGAAAGGAGDAGAPPPFAATDRVDAEGPVNFRAGPGTAYPVLTTLAVGTPLAATGAVETVDEVLWRQFALADGRVGWVRDQNVAPAGT